MVLVNERERVFCPYCDIEMTPQFNCYCSSGHDPQEIEIPKYECFRCHVTIQKNIIYPNK
jgi:hypothetical protein